MKISSKDNRSWLSIECNRDSFGYTSFQVEAHADIGHGQFDAKNSNVHFSKLNNFAEEFDRFITNRNLSPRLDGDYDTYIVFFSRENAVIVQYRLGDAYGKSANFYQLAEFEIEQEYLLDCLAGFRELASAYSAAPGDKTEIPSDEVEVIVAETIRISGRGAVAFFADDAKPWWRISAHRVRVATPDGVTFETVASVELALKRHGEVMALLFPYVDGAALPPGTRVASLAAIPYNKLVKTPPRKWWQWFK